MKKFLKLAGIFLVLAVSFYGYVFYRGYTAGPEIESRVSAFMQSASDQDIDSTYGFMTDELKASLPRDKFAKDVEEHFDQIKFTSQEQEGFYYSLAIKKLSLPRGIYEYQGFVTYTGGKYGNVFMVFIREDGEWKILILDISDPY